MASVPFICGTQEAHTGLEARISRFLGMEDTVLYSSCCDANGGLFETILGENDAVVSEALNHHQSSMGFACRRPGGTATPTTT
jgi:glycine C-acetyltransferase